MPIEAVAGAGPPSITCPRCGRVSYSRGDIEHRFCGACGWHEDLAEGAAMHTKDKLAAELRKAGLGDMAIKAAQGYYHDFLSPLATPELQLLEDLEAAGCKPAFRAAALDLIVRHKRGEFDASKEESDEWAASAEGRGAMEALLQKPERPEKQQVGRLAMRVEGDFWRAYYAMPGTMEGALLLGSIAMGAVQREGPKGGLHGADAGCRRRPPRRAGRHAAGLERAAGGART